MGLGDGFELGAQLAGEGGAEGRGHMVIIPERDQAVDHGQAALGAPQTSTFTSATGVPVSAAAVAW